MKIQVRASGINEVINSNNKIRNALNNGAFTRKIAEKTVNRAKYRAPRKTGKLIKAIKAVILNQYSFSLECEVEDERGEPYAKYLEEGTKFIKIGTPESPRMITSGGGKVAFLPFLRWAIWRTMQEADNIFKETVLNKK